MKQVFFLISFAMTIAFSSCSSSRNTAKAGKACLLGEWTIVSALDTSTEGGMKPAVISFSEDGKVNGCATVNNFFGEYTSKGKSLSFSDKMGMTRMMGSSMEMESAITTAMMQVSSYSVKDKTAVLLDGNGKTVMVLNRK